MIVIYENAITNDIISSKDNSKCINILCRLVSGRFLIVLLQSLCNKMFESFHKFYSRLFFKVDLFIFVVHL